MFDSLSVSCFRPLYVKNPRFRKPPNSFTYQYNKLLHWRDYLENYYIEVPCGKCYLCRKKRANGWRIRLIEELKAYPTFYHKGVQKYRVVFATFTYRQECLPTTDNRTEFADHLRHWRDLWRKKYGKSVRFWAITDKGSQFGRVHLHLLIFNPFDYKKGKPLSIHALNEVNFLWKYGYSRKPSWLESHKGVTYITGYLTTANLEKDAIKHGKPICKEALEYVPFVFCSNGLGANYLTNPNYVYDEENDLKLYRYNGYLYGLPSYYRYKLIDSETRWHQNLLRKYYTLDYVSYTDDLRYKLLGRVTNYSIVKHLYYSSFAKYDMSNNKNLKIYVK